MIPLYPPSHSRQLNPQVPSDPCPDPRAYTQQLECSMRASQKLASFQSPQSWLRCAAMNLARMRKTRIVIIATTCSMNMKWNGVWFDVPGHNLKIGKYARLGGHEDPKSKIMHPNLVKPQRTNFAFALLFFWGPPRSPNFNIRGYRIALFYNVL